MSRSVSGRPPSPTDVCQAIQASCWSGARAPASRSSSAAHRPGHSERTAIRARTCALRLVSWVDRTVPVAYQSRARRTQNAWNSPGSTEGRPGSPPTSLTESSGAWR